ncbi:hypothetical protein ACFQ0B_22130 [Nonomuraea thailandensis]
MTAVAGRRAAVFGWTRFGLLVLFVVVFLIPIYVLLVTSFKPLTEADPGQAWNLPQTWTTEAWRVAWEKLAPACGTACCSPSPARCCRARSAP